MNLIATAKTYWVLSFSRNKLPWTEWVLEKCSYTLVRVATQTLWMFCVQDSKWMQLPAELWWEILLKSVVDTALQSDAEDSLSQSLASHALVCRSWSCLIKDPWFKHKATKLLYTLGRQFFLADRTNGRAIGTLLRLSVCLSVCLWRYVLWLNGAF